MNQPANSLAQANTIPHPRTGPGRSADAVQSSPIHRVAPADQRDRTGDVRRMTAGIARGDDAAFRRFYAAYFDRLHRYLLVISRGREDVAQDAMQDTMMRVVKYARPLEDEAALWNWLRAVARTAFIDLARKRGRTSSAVPLEVLAEPAAGESGGGDPESELGEHLAACMEHLGPLEQALVTGKYFEGKSLVALSSEHGLSPKAVESRLARIRKKLKAKILERLKR
jgi:RNA polymerase sigma-70 factor (ECF subfamily)